MSNACPSEHSPTGEHHWDGEMCEYCGAPTPDDLPEADQVLDVLVNLYKDRSKIRHAADPEKLKSVRGAKKMLRRAGRM